MTNFDKSLIILTDMITHGYHMFGETAEHMISRTTDDPEFWEQARAFFFKHMGIA